MSKGKTDSLCLHCNEKEVQKTNNNVYEIENLSRYDFVGCKFHRSTDMVSVVYEVESLNRYDFGGVQISQVSWVHLALHRNGHHWRRRQLFYKLPTAVTPAASMVCPVRQAAADIPCPGMPVDQVEFSLPCHYIHVIPSLSPAAPMVCLARQLGQVSQALA